MTRERPIEDCWQTFAYMQRLARGTPQWTVARHTFFAGAAALFGVMMQVLDDSPDADTTAEAFAATIAQELRDFEATVRCP